jgi:hypothetical protein
MSISRISRKSKKRIEEEIRKKVKVIQKHPTSQTIKNYNLFVRGVHNYYQKATKVSVDFGKIYYSCLPALYNRLKSIGKYQIPRSPPLMYKKRYSTNCRTFRISGEYLFPLANVKWKKAYNVKPQINNYTKSGRAELIKELKPMITEELWKMDWRQTGGQTMEYLDNKISRYFMQNGKCAVTGRYLTADITQCHHILPKSLGGTDQFDNLVILYAWTHKLVHATEETAIKRYLKQLQLTEKQLEKLNKYREKCNLTKISLSKE